MSDIKYSYELFFTPLNLLTTNEHISQVDNLRVRDDTRGDLYIIPLVLSIEVTMFNATIVRVIKKKSIRNFSLKFYKSVTLRG